MQWIKAHAIPLTGLVLLVLVAASFAQSAYQQGKVAQAVRCQNSLLQVVVARGTASNDERTALRSLVLGMKDGFSEDDQSKFAGYEYAIDRADVVYQSSGSLAATQLQCINAK